MKKLMALLYAAILLTVTVGSGNADYIKFNFTGVVNGVDVSDGKPVFHTYMKIGDPVSGYFVYNTDAPNEIVNSTEYGRYLYPAPFNPNGLVFSVGALKIIAVPGWDNNFVIDVWNDDQFEHDALAFGWGGFQDADEVNGLLDIASMTLIFHDDTEQAFNSTSLPISLDLEKFNRNTGFVDTTPVGNDGWQRFSFEVTSIEVEDIPIIAIDFGVNGLWLYDGVTWNQITTFNPVNTKPWLNGLAVDLSPYGLFNYNGTAWDPALTGLPTEQMTSWTSGLAADFGTYGLFSHNGSAWEQLTSINPVRLSSWTRGLAVDITPYGLWNHNGTSWDSQLTGLGTENLVSWTGGLAVDFGTYGLFINNNTSWTLLSTYNPENIAAWSTNLAADFGTSGLWSYNGSQGWVNISSLNPSKMTGWSGGLAVDFGAGGLYSWNGSAWTKLSDWSPEGMTKWGNSLVLDLGANGVWVFNGSSLTRLLNWNPDKMIEGLDGGAVSPLTASIISPSVNTTIVAGNSVNFQGSVSGGVEPFSYAWNFDGGSTNVTVEDPGNVAFNTPGTYSVTFTVTDSNGNSDISDSVIVTVSPQAAPLLASVDSPTLATTITAGASINFQGSASGGSAPYNYAWDFDGGAVNVAVKDPGDVDFNTSGTYSVTLTVTDADGNSDISDPVIVTVNPQGAPLSASIDSPTGMTTITAGASINFQGSASGGTTPYSYDWDFGGGAVNVEVENPGNVTFNTAGTYSVTLTVTDADGDSDASDPVIVTVNPQAVPLLAAIDSAAGTATITAGASINFQGSASGGTAPYSYTWDFDGGAVSVAVEDPGDVTFNTPGTYSVTFTVTDADGNSDISDPVAITVNPGSVTIGVIPDTGQTTSYTDTFGEDSDYSINPQSYTKLDANGNNLPNSATTWVMVRDNVTGLIWENKTNDEGIHGKNNFYNWQNAQDIFITQINNSNFGGNSDWRMPTVKELSTLRNLDEYKPSINDSYFPNTEPTLYWSSTTFANNMGYAWMVNFSSGDVYRYNKSNLYHVRAVRGGRSGAFDDSIIPGRMLDNHDGTVTDTETGLMWQQGEPGQKRWADALTYCETLTLAGYSDWRLPNSNELQSIVDYQVYAPAADTAAFPGIPMPSGQVDQSDYWSSSAYEYYGVWGRIVYFYIGNVNIQGTGGLVNVRAVRGGQ